jgi:hypothetical protein
MVLVLDIYCVIQQNILIGIIKITVSFGPVTIGQIITVKRGITRMNGSRINGITTNYPNDLSIISVRTSGNVHADNFGYDRGITDRQWIGSLGELIIYSVSLSDIEVREIEGYLAEKWALRTSLSSSHDYHSSKTVSNYKISGTPSVGGNYKVSIIAKNSTHSAHGILDLNISSSAAEVVASTPISITSGSANIMGEVTRTGGQYPILTVFWGDEDGGNVPANWDNNFSIGLVGEGFFSHMLSGLVPNTQYFYAFSANNFNGGNGGTSWSDTSSLTTDANTSLPVLSDVLSVSDITLVGAKLNAVLKSTGGDENTTVTFYWGEEDGGTNEIAWNQSIIVNQANVGSITGEIISGLGFPKDYYMRVKASNILGSVWSETSVSFTPLAGEAGFTPVDFSGLKLWLDASDISGTGQLLPLNNGDSVSQFVDKSGQARHATQDISGAQPSFIFGALNDMPNVSFDGANDYLEFEAIDTIRTVFFVLTRETGNRGFLLGDDLDYSFHPGGNAIWSGTWTSPFIINGSTLINGNLRNNTLSTNYAYDEPVLIAIRTEGNVRASSFSKDRSNEVYWKGKLAELIIYNEELPTSILRKVEGILST